MMIRFTTILLGWWMGICNSGFGQTPSQLYVTADKEVKPYVWGGDSSPLFIDTLVCTDRKLNRLLTDNIALDYNAIQGKILYSDLYYGIKIDTIGGLTLLKCYHPYDLAHDFYEYATRLIAKNEDDIFYNELGSVFGYTIINHVPVVISGNAAGVYFKKKSTVQMANPYPSNAIVYDNSGIHNPDETRFDMGADEFIIASYLYRDGTLEDYSEYVIVPQKPITISTALQEKNKPLLYRLLSTF